jgi:hypothetical protein
MGKNGKKREKRQQGQGKISARQGEKMEKIEGEKIEQDKERGKTRVWEQKKEGKKTQGEIKRKRRKKKQKR